MMLRAKQIGTLSQCVRTFYLSGSRSGSADGAACTCADDDTSVAARQTKRTDPILKQQTLTPASCSSVKAASPVLKDAESPSYAGSASTSSSASKKVSPDKDVQSSQASLVTASGITAQDLVRAGVSTVGILSELISYKIPATDRHCHLTTVNCVVDNTPSFSNSSPTVRAKCSKAQPRSKVSSIEERSNSSDPTSGQKYAGTKACDARKVNSRQNNTATDAKPRIKEYRLVPSEAKYQFCTKDSDKRVTSWQNNTATDAKPHRLPSEAKYQLCTKDSDKRVSSSTDCVRSSDKFHYPARAVRFQTGGALSSGNRCINSVCTVEIYYHTLQQLKWGPQSEETLNSLHYKLDAFQANQVLKLLRDHSVALGFFRWLKHQAGFKHDQHTYTTMIGILGQARQFGIVRRLLDEMEAEGCYPTVVTYNRLIHAYGRANFIREAVGVFHRMQELGFEPDRVTYCTLIDIHAKAGFLDVALDLYRRMQEVGLSPDTFTYSAMVNSLGKAGHLAAAYNLFVEMIDRGCVPNLVTYNIMIALQAKARNYPNAVKIYRDMQAAGFRPDKITYSIVMEVLGHCGRLDEAEAVFMEMERDWVPDEPVYGLLVDMWGKAGNVDRARSWFRSMLDAGLRPNVPTCNSLLSGFLKAGRFPDARDVLWSMVGAGLVPSLQTFTLLLSCCTETARSHMGLCQELMALTGHPAHVFLMSLPDAEPGGRNVRDHASRFLELMHSEDRESKRGLLDAVIDFLHKSGLKEEAGFVWEAAAQRNVYPDSVREKRSSYWLINLHVMSEGTAVTALSRTLAWFQRRMLASGCGPHRIDIVTGWGRRSRVTGSSLVRRSVEELLSLFGFPFFTEHGNSGCFVGCGEALNQWLLNPYVERMHLL